VAFAADFDVVEVVAPVGDEQCDSKRQLSYALEQIQNYAACVTVEPLGVAFSQDFDVVVEVFDEHLSFLDG